MDTNDDELPDLSEWDENQPRHWTRDLDDDKCPDRSLLDAINDVPAMLTQHVLPANEAAGVEWDVVRCGLWLDSGSFAFFPARRGNSERIEKSLCLIRSLQVKRRYLFLDLLAESLRENSDDPNADEACVAFGEAEEQLIGRLIAACIGREDGTIPVEVVSCDELTEPILSFRC